MTDNEMIVNENTWNKLTPENRDWIIYQTLLSQGQRITKLEKGRLYFKVVSFAGGVIGGIIGFFCSRVFHN